MGIEGSTDVRWLGISCVRKGSMGDGSVVLEDVEMRSFV